MGRRVSQSVQTFYNAAVRSGRLKADPAQQGAITALEHLYQRLTTVPETPGFWARLRHKPDPVQQAAGVYLYGPVGRGKSMLMQFFIDAMVQWNKNALPARRHKIVRHHFHEFMLGLHQQLYLQKDNPDQMQNRLAELADELKHQVDILCFDEFHVTDVADAMLLMPYFTRLLESGVTLIATSNFAPADLYKNGLQRVRFLPFIDLLQQRLDVVSVSGEQDYRLLRWQDKAAQDHWLLPLDPVTATEFKTLFADLAGYDVVHDNEQIDIPNQQRSITVFRASPHIAWLQMEHMLNESVGAADFLAVATRFKIVLLDGVTVFTNNENDRAKRFMLLIDTLYEASTQIYVRASSQPDKLYPANGSLAFEFARTVSRLQEMRYRKI